MSGVGVTEAIHFLERYGYLLLFGWVFAEQGALPIPSAPLLVAVGALVRTGRLNAAIAIASCAAGALLADGVWFYFGRRRGKRVLRFLCRVSLEPDSCVRQTENAFRKYGLKTLLISKFIPGLNAVAAPLAGDSGVSVIRFVAVDAIGIAIWSGAYIGAGYLFGDKLELVLTYAQRMGSGFAILVAGLFAGWIAWKFVQRWRFLNRLVAARITPEEMRERMDNGEDLYVVDLRSDREEALSSLPGAIRISAEDLTTRANQIPRDREIILFCS